MAIHIRRSDFMLDGLLWLCGGVYSMIMLPVGIVTFIFVLLIWASADKDYWR